MSVLILFYHSISENQGGCVDPSIVVRPKSFEQQLQYFSKYWRVITLAECVNTLHKGDSLPPNSLVLTFDDGYRDNLTVAAPLLRQHNLPATFFLATGYINTGQAKWEDRLSYILSNTKRSNLRVVLPGGTRIFWLRKKGDRTRVFNQMSLILGHLSLFERDKVLSQVQGLAGIPDEDIPRDLMLNWNEARLLADTPDFTIGCHTVTHERLSRLTDEEIRREIIESRRTIEHELGIHVRFLSYPYGTWADIDKRTIQIAGDCGLDGAVTTLYGRNDLGGDAFVLRRVLGADTTGANFSIGTFVRGSWLGEPLRQLSRLTHQIF